MKAIKVAICDDDKKELQFFYNMCRKIKKQEGIEIQVRLYESGDAMLFHFDDGDGKVLYAVDIILLDIMMPGQNGMDVAKKLRGLGFQGSIIFITHSKDAEHFRNAFDVQAFNYITKDEDIQNRFIKTFVDAAEEAKRRRSKTLIFSSIAETRQIDIGSISHFEVHDHVVTVFYNGEDSFKFISALAKIENLVYGENFIRVHRSFLVSTSHIVSSISSENSITMSNQAIVPVSKKYKAVLREAMEQGNKKVGKG